MNFLGLGGFLEDTVGRAGMSIFRYIFFQIDKAIYELTKTLYDIFYLLCNGKILSNSQISDLFGRISVILGMVMLFKVLFSFVQYLVDPDGGNNGKSMTNVIKRAILVVVMLGVSTWVFNLLSTVQTAVIQSNAISKILLPYDIDEESFGTTVSGTTFLTFFTIGDVGDGLFGGSDATTCDNNYYIKAKNKILTDGKYDMMSECVNEYAKVTFDGEDKERTTFVVDYNFLMATFVGIFLAYFIFSYTVSVGIRMIQIAVLQILSPVAIIGYLSPKDENMFTKWSKVYISTYIDVFLRIIIINFAVCVIGIIMEQGDSTFWKSIGSPKGILLTSYIKIIMMIAILQFAKKAPELLGKILPTGDSGIGFGLGTTLAPLGVVSGAVAGGVGGAVVGGLGRFNAQRKLNKNKDGSHKEHWVKSNAAALFGGMATGIGRGTLGGAKKGNVISNVKGGISNQAKANDKYIDLHSRGGSARGVIASKIMNTFGNTKAQEANRKIGNYQSVIDSTQRMNDLAENIGSVKNAKTAWENAKARGATDDEIEELYTTYKDKRKEAKLAAMQGNMDEFNNSEDRVYAEQMSLEFNNMKSDIAVNDIQITDAAGNRIDFSTPDQYTNDNLDAASYLSSSNISKIKGSDEYKRALANDTAAGVNSNDTKK